MRPLLDPALHVVEEPRRRQPVDDPVVEGHREIHHPPDHDRIVDYDGALLDGFGAEDRGLRLVDDRLTGDRSKGSWVVEREGSALDVFGTERLAAGAAGW